MMALMKDAANCLRNFFTSVSFHRRYCTKAMSRVTMNAKGICHLL